MQNIFTTPINTFETLEFASSLFKEKKLKYGKFEYSKHMIDVLNIGIEHIHLISDFYNHDNPYPPSTEEMMNVENSILNALICHDVLEDCGITYNDLKKQIGNLATDIVYDVTNELGKNRKERSEKTYPKIRNNILAVFVKCCDRLANVNFSKIELLENKNQNGLLREGTSNMYKKYFEEYPEFKKMLNTPLIFQNLWKKLDEAHSEIPIRIQPRGV